MDQRIDQGLHRLRAAAPVARLDGLEADVWSAIDAKGRLEVFGERTLQVQLVVTCAALLLGVAVAQWAGSNLMPRRLNSEIVVLSDDSAMAPSVRLEGGL
jgi:hypothetical protein